MNRHLLILLLFLSLNSVGFTEPSAEPKLLVIVNASQKVESITQLDLKYIYTNEMTQWAKEGGKIIPIMPKISKIRTNFINNYLNMSVDEYLSLWKRLIFTGKGKAPKNLADENEVIEFVKNNPGAIGFVSQKPDDASIKILVIESNTK